MAESRQRDTPSHMRGPLLMGPDVYPESDVPGMGVFGWLSSYEAAWLYEQAQTMGSIVEVGVLRGRSAFALLSGCQGPVWCIDPFEDPGDHAYRAFLASCGHFPNVRPIRGYSPAAASQVPGIVDMTWIDGDHSYDAVVADLDAWVPKTRKLICGHDFSDPADWPEGEEAGYRGVWDAVNERFGQENVRLAEGTSIWYVNLTPE